MAAIAEACAAGKLRAEVTIVVASSAKSPALARARELGLKTAVVPVGEDYGPRLVEALTGCDIVCLAGYLRLLPSDVLQAFPGRVVNVHPALLPKFGGRGMYGLHVHEAVLAAGEKESGCTVHLVTEAYDEGTVLIQKRCPVLPDDTPESLAARILPLEHEAYVEALSRMTSAEGEPKPVKADPDLQLQHPLFTHVALPLIRCFGWLIMTLLGPYRYRNRASIPRAGGVLILSNHRADIDPIAVQMGCPRPIYFMAKSELFAMPLLGRVIRWFRAFPVKRGEPDRAAIKKAVALVQAGYVVGVFPEGQLTESGRLQPLKPGAALLVRLGGVPVLCCGLRGTDKVMPYGSMVPRPAFGWVECVWGEPRTFDKGTSAEEILAWIERELRHLSGEEDASS